MKKRIHAISGGIACLTIFIFWVSTLFSELFFSIEAVVTVKQWIVWPGLFILVPSIAITGGTGFQLSKKRSGRLVENKKKRMPVISANGFFILIPSAILLHRWAAAGSFDFNFYILQSIELIAGATNLIMMGRNMRDGLRMSGARSKRLIR